jgi:predicted nucleic acid-binding protein
VKRFVREPGSDDVLSRLREGDWTTSRLTWIEVVAAVAHRAHRGDLGRRQFQSVLRTIAAESASVDALEIDDEVESGARECLLRHPLRAADAIQLASCLLVAQRFGRRIELLCYDARLAAAARAEGLIVFGAP